MSDEFHRPRTANKGKPRRRKLHVHEFTRHRGSHDELVRLVQRRAAIRAKKGLAGIRQDAPYFRTWIGDERTLRTAWDYLSEFGGQTPGVDNLHYDDLPEREVWRILREIRDSIFTGEYEPARDKLARIPKGFKRGNRTLALQCIFDRVVQRACIEIMQPYMDPHFSDHSFAFRPRRGVLDAIAYADFYSSEENRRVWVLADLRDAFSRVPLARLREVVMRYFGDEELASFLDSVVSGASVPGLRQGSPLSPFLLNLYLHHFLDRPWHKQHPELPLLRFADDILIPCHSVREARAAHDNLVGLLRPTGMVVKGTRESDVVTASAPAEWLGFSILRKKQDFVVSISDRAWENLRDRFAEAHEKPNSPQFAIDALRGWTNDKAPCYKTTDHHRACERILAIGRDLAFDELPRPALLVNWWQRAYARWSKLRKRIRARLVMLGTKTVSRLHL